MTETMPTITLPGYVAPDVIAMLADTTFNLVRQAVPEFRDMQRASAPDPLFTAPAGSPTPAEAYTALRSRWVELERIRQTLVHGGCPLTDADLERWFEDECRHRSAQI